MNSAIVILNFNGEKYLEQFLPTVIENRGACRVVVIDNGSTDKSVAWLKQNHPTIECIQIRKNCGFAAGYNKGLAQISADVFILLNSDVQVTANWTIPLLKALENPQVAAVQPKILSFHNKDQFEYAGAAGGLMDPVGFPLCRGRILSHVENDHGQYDQEKRIFWASGAAIAIQAELFRTIDGFDGDYFAHMEEIDLCWRLKRAGYTILYTPHSIVFHVGGGTLSYQSPFKTYLNFRNSWVTILKNQKRSRALIFSIRFLLDILALLRFVIIFQLPNAKSVLKSWWYLMRNFNKIRLKKHAAQAVINNSSIGPETVREGRYPKSIIWQYYIQGKKTIKV